MGSGSRVFVLIALQIDECSDFIGERGVVDDVDDLSAMKSRKCVQQPIEILRKGMQTPLNQYLINC